MEATSVIESASPTEQIVLLGLAELDRRERTPAQTHDVRRACRSLAEETTVVGKPSEADVVRCLYRIESTGIVEEIDPDATSPVGKGRPAYELTVDPETVAEAVEECAPFEFEAADRV